MAVKRHVAFCAKLNLLRHINAASLQRMFDDELIKAKNIFGLGSVIVILGGYLISSGDLNTVVGVTKIGFGIILVALPLWRLIVFLRVD